MLYFLLSTLSFSILKILGQKNFYDDLEDEEEDEEAEREEEQIDVANAGNYGAIIN